MKKLKLSIEYGCYPLWIYNEEDEIIDNDLPEEAKDDKELEKILDKIQELYDSGFINNSKVFEAIGRPEEVEKEILVLTNKAQEILDERYSKYYEIMKKY